MGSKKYEGIMQVQTAWHGARGVDCVTLLTDVSSAALKAANYDFGIQYLGGGITPQLLADILGAGMAFMPVTFADRFDGNEASDHCDALGLPFDLQDPLSSTTVWLDLEGIGAALAPASVIAQATSWAARVKARGRMPGLYVGAGCKLTGQELYVLPHVRYWKGQSHLLDRNGNVAEPACGWSCTQTYPHKVVCGVDVDIDFIAPDYRLRMPNWVIA